MPLQPLQPLQPLPLAWYPFILGCAAVAAAADSGEVLQRLVALGGSGGFKKTPVALGALAW